MSFEQKALLASLNIQQWSGFKFDKNTSTEVLIQKNAQSINAGRFNKKLLPDCEEFRKIGKLATQIRSDFYDYSLPWSTAGMRLMPTRVYTEFLSKYQVHRQEWDRLVTGFVDFYNYHTLRARDSLGALYNPNDYPHEDTLRSRFDLDFKVGPVPQKDFRVELGAQEIEGIRRDIEFRNREAFKQATMDAWQQLFDKVKAMHDKLSDPKGKFRDSLVGNLQDTCQLLVGLNFSDDPDLETMRQEVEKHLSGYRPDMLRHSAPERKNAVKKSAEILSKMDAFMGAP